MNTRLAATLVGRRSVLSISQAPRQLGLTRQCDEPSTLGFRSGAAHINPMPHKASLPLTFDLFEYAPTISPPPSASALTAAKPAEAANLSDAQLTEGLANLLGELQRRMEANQGHRPELEKAVRTALRVLKQLSPQVPRSAQRHRVTNAPSLQEGQRKAVRAALQAGVAPGQVARHFGLSLAAVRKVLTDAA